MPRFPRLPWIALAAVLAATGCGQAFGPANSATGLVSASGAKAGAVPRATYEGAFPPGFLWGVATAGYQYEGGDTSSNWAAWERAGRTKDPIGVAIDHWNRYEEDFDLAKGLGLGAYRLSIEWARIEPKQGQIDPVAVKHYHDVLAALRARGLEPLVTVSHWAYPAWMDEPGPDGRRGWESTRMKTELARHAGWVAKEYGSQVKWWLTLNEPNTVGATGYVLGMHAPGKRDPLAYQRMMDNQIAIHKAMYGAIHAADADAQVSLCPVAVHAPEHRGEYTASSLRFYNNEMDIFDQVVPRYDDGKRKPLRDGGSYLDYVAYNYFYSPRLIDYPKIAHYTSWPVYPEGIYEIAKKLHARYRMPVMITENGMATEGARSRKDGWSREAFIVNHVAQLKRAIAEGVPVLGYMHWSLVDNYEWGSYKETLGLYGVDRRDPELRRFKTPAADVYAAIAKANAVTAPLLDRYLGKKN